MTAPRLVEHFFRHEYGRLVARLCRRVGVENVEDIEDAVQTSLMKAIEAWTIDGLPDNPSAWLFRVASNQLLDELRKQSRRRRILQDKGFEIVDAIDSTEPSSTCGPQDDLLRMLFVCCNESIPLESQLVFTLKTLCGFSVREISIRLFASEANVYKRLERARSRLRKLRPRIGVLSHQQYSSRLSSVCKILYLIFTEGYLSSDSEIALRHELCDEALRLAGILAEHDVGKSPESFALLSLMHLHSARMAARQDESGGLLLLEEQDRKLWDQDRIRIGLKWLAKSSEGEHFTRYHAEAGIAAEHCMSASFSETRWDKVDECYAVLERFTDSPLHKLNRAVAIAESQSPAAALELLDKFVPPTWLSGSHMWSAVLSDLHRRSGNEELSKRYREIAYELAPTPQVKQLLIRRLDPAD